MLDLFSFECRRHWLHPSAIRSFPRKNCVSQFVCYVYDCFFPPLRFVHQKTINPYLHIKILGPHFGISSRTYYCWWNFGHTWPTIISRVSWQISGFSGPSFSRTSRAVWIFMVPGWSASVKQPKTTTHLRSIFHTSSRNQQRSIFEYQKWRPFVNVARTTYISSDAVEK